jgi:Zn-dependent protease with chaperone function
MPFLFLLFLTLACLPVPWPGPPLFPWVDTVSGTLFTVAAMAGVVVAAFFLARWTRRGLLQDDASREQVLHRYARMRNLHLIGLFVVYGLAVGVLGWGWTVQHVFTADTWKQVFDPYYQGDLDRMMPGVELIILAPFLVAMVLSWACFYDVEQAAHPQYPEWGRWSYVGFQVRQSLALILPPLVVLIAIQGFVRRFPDLQGEPLFRTASYGVLIAFLISMPWMFRLVLGLKPLPEGPLRSRLLQAAQRLNFRCSNILLWSTRGNVANAMVVGILPRVRYVVFTDRLVSELELEEVEAVFGHEVGHVKHRHMLYYLGFLLISLAVVVGAWTSLARQKLGVSSDWVMVPLVPFFGAYVFVVFGFLSRRCERQADIFGCRAVSCDRRDCQGHDESVQAIAGGSGLCATGIHTFIGALEKVAQLNGISRSKPGWLSSWQHSTIARRVDFLQRMLGDPNLEPRFQRAVALVKWGLLLGLLVLMMVLVRTQLWDNPCKLTPDTAAHTAPSE